MIIEVPTVTERLELYIYHGKDYIDRIRINHDKDQRHVIDIEDLQWPTDTPEQCTYNHPDGRWYIALDTGKEYLLCPGCGLDCT